MKANHLFRVLLSAALLTFVAGGAWAHPGHGEHVGGFASGLMHPLSGVDHLLAMLAVGLWAARLGGRAVWAVPLTFMTSMALGALLAFVGAGVPFVEPLVAASVLVLGLALSVRSEMPRWVPFALTAGFAIFHGLAHGAELPGGAARIEYFSGFMLSTGAIHALGIGLALLIGKGASRERAIGVPIALAGVWLLAGAF